MALDHAAGHLRLSGKAHLRRHMGRLQAGAIVGPALRQIERAVDEGMPVPRHIGREHADLAVGDLARRAGVLPRHTAGRLALLEKAGLIDHQHRVRVGQRLQRVVAHQVAQRVRLPTTTPQDGLLAPGARVSGRLRAHPARLAPLRPQQTLQELPRRGSHPLLCEQGTDPRLYLPQRRRPQLQRRLDRGTRHPFTPGYSGRRWGQSPNVRS
jgi:hypothetical protein